MNKLKTYKSSLFLGLLLSSIMLYLSSCSENNEVTPKYFFELTKSDSLSVENINKTDFSTLDNLDLGFYKGSVWIKLVVSNVKAPSSYVIVGNDLINRNYRFYKLDTVKNKLEPVSYVKNLKKQDHRTFNNSKPNFKIDLVPNENCTYYISTYSDGRILQATPKLQSFEAYTSSNNQSIIFDSIFYVVIAILLIINIFHWRILKNKVYYSYGFYIISSCFMYLFVEGRLYGLGLNHDTIDHLMFISIRLWILSSILFSMKFLDVKESNPTLFKLIKAALVLSLGGTTIYQLVFYNSSIQYLHTFENITGFVWIIISIIILGISYKRKKQEAKYYLIAFSFFILFVCLGLVDSHLTILPGDPFSYFKVGTVFEFIGFTYFISRLIKMKINDSKNLESALINNQNKLKQAEEKLSEKLKKESNTSTIEKSHLVGVLKLVEKAITNDSEWEEFKAKFENLNPKFLENILTKHPDLSKSEVRLLILIKLNYSQKEVANILGIEPNSVKKAKNRVRKKLQITDAIVLNDYVNMF